MKIELSDPKKVLQFSIILQNIRAYSEHVVINISKKGLFMQGMDSSHCILFEIKLNPTWFNLFDFDEENDNSTLGINSNILHKIIAILRDGQTIVLEADDDDKLNISFIGGNDKTFNKYFEIPLMDINKDIVEITIEDTEVELIMTSKSFHELINQFQNFDEKLSLHFTEEEVSMFSDGIEGMMKVNINLDDVTEYSVVEDLNMEQSYSLKHIAMMCLFNKLSDEFNMTFSEDKPMTGKYNLDDESFVKFYLTSKIEDNE